MTIRPDIEAMTTVGLYDELRRSLETDEQRDMLDELHRRHDGVLDEGIDMARKLLRLGERRA